MKAFKCDCCGAFFEHGTSHYAYALQAKDQIDSFILDAFVSELCKECGEAVTAFLATRRKRLSEF